MHPFDWRPGIGDPTLMGWLTVAYYFITAYCCWSLGRRMRALDGAVRGEASIWYGFAVLFLVLGINKQLDLQTALTELGRVIAYAQGWYQNRRLVQAVFIMALGVISAAMLVVLYLRARQAHRGTFIALIGAALLISFIVMRAASFHHVDVLIGSTILGMRWNWIFEIGGILLVMYGNRVRAASLAPARAVLAGRGPGRGPSRRRERG